MDFVLIKKKVIVEYLKCFLRITLIIDILVTAYDRSSGIL